MFKRLFKHNNASIKESLNKVVQEYYSNLDWSVFLESARDYKELWEGNVISCRRMDHWLLFQASTKTRVFLIRELLKHFNITHNNLLEVGSAGDLSASIALPSTRVVSLDIDPLVMYNEINNIPEPVYSKLNTGPIVSFYGGRSRVERDRDKKIIGACVPNYRGVLGNGDALPFLDDTFDISLSLGPNNLDVFSSEMTRVVRRGGYLVAIQDGFVGGESPYKRDYEDKTGTLFKVDKDKFKKLEIPEKFRNLEKGVPKGFFGKVFEVYQKKNP